MKQLILAFVLFAILVTPVVASDPFGGPISNTSGNGTSPREAIYIANGCATMQIQAGTAKWFKIDAWADKQVQIWIDDELGGAAKPSGSSVWGAALQYMKGKSPSDPMRANAYPIEFIDGYVMAIYDPEATRPLNLFAEPNVAILSLNVDKRGFLQNAPFNTKADIFGVRIHGYGAFNKSQPSHLLFYEGNFSGWVYVMVYNQMIWDDTMSVCSIRK